MAPAAIQAAQPVARRSSLRLPGGVFAATTLFIAIGALNSQNNLLFWVFGLAVGVVIVSGVVSGWSMLSVRVRRLPPGAVRAGEACTLRYQVLNQARWTPAVALHVEECDAGGAIGVQGFGAGAAPGGRTVVSCVGRPERRGVARLPGPMVWTTFPFGFTRKLVRFDQSATLLIHPARLALRPGLLDQMLTRAPTGSPSATPSTSGDELFAVREYSPGDSPRRVAWRASARLGELRVRQFSEQAAHAVWLQLNLVDAEPHEAERAIAVASTIVEEAGERGVRVGVSIPAWGFWRAPGSGAGREVETLDALAMAAPADDRDLNPGREDAFVARGAILVGIHSGDTIDVRHPERWLREGAELPSGLMPEHADEADGFSLRRTFAHAIDRLVGAGEPE